MPSSAVYVNLPIATDGLNTEIEPTTVNVAYSPFMKNFIVEPWGIRKRMGYTQLGSNLPLSGTGGALISYTDARGTTHLIALTTTKAYHYNSSSDEWDDITPAAGNFTGDVDNIWAFCVAHDTSEFSNNGGTALIITNNVDDLQYFEGHSDDKFKVLSHGYPSFSHCKEVAEFWNHLFLINYNNGANNVRSLAFASAGDVDNFSDGTSGGATLTDSVGELLRPAKLGQDMILYSAESIAVARYYGQPVIFEFPSVIYKTSIIGQRALVALDNVHYFLGKNQEIYAYAGGTYLTSIGLEVNGYLFDMLDSTKTARIVAGRDVSKRCVYFAIPRSGEDYPKAVFAYNYYRKHWEYHEFADSVRALAVFSNQYTWYCDDARWADEYCDEQSFYCDASSGQSGYSLACFITDDGYVMQLDDTGGQDDDANIACEYQSLDATVDKEEHFGRWEWVSFVAKADISNSTVQVFYSTDGGETWTELSDSPVSLSSDWTTYRLPLDVVSRRIRFKLYQYSDKDIKLRSAIRCKVVLLTERD